MPSGIQVMKVLFQINGSSIQSVTNYYEVMVYGKTEILNYWNGYDDRRPDPICEVAAVLNGRTKVMKDGKQFNNLTLTHKSIKFIYEQYIESN
jgi:hypothetical protein